MKKILILALAILSINFVLANEAFNLQEAVKTSPMPTDEEIRETIKKYNFDKAQQDYLFKEMKKNLEELYSNKNFQPVLNQTLEEQKEVINNINKSIEEQEKILEKID